MCPVGVARAQMVYVHLQYPFLHLVTDITMGIPQLKSRVQFFTSTHKPTLFFHLFPLLFLFHFSSKFPTSLHQNHRNHNSAVIKMNEYTQVGDVSDNHHQAKGLQSLAASRASLAL